MAFRPRREPDFSQVLKVLRRRGKPDHLPFYERLASPGFIARRSGTDFDRLGPDDPGYWRTYVDFWLGLGYDCIPLEIPLRCPLQSSDHVAGARSHRSEATICLRSIADFEQYP